MKKHPPITNDSEYSYPLHTVGTASGRIESEEECDAVKRLHEVVKEVTGKEVQAQPKPRIGFLP